MTTNKPNALRGDLANLPPALQPLCCLDHWVLWGWLNRKDRKGNTKWTKPPYVACDGLRNARNNAPETWTSYAQAIDAMARANGKIDGIGFMLLGTTFDVVDLDHCLDPETGEPDAWAAHWIAEARGAYVERTPSGNGLRIIALGEGDKVANRFKVDGARDGAGIEIYRNNERYITITGLQVGECTELPPSGDLLAKIEAHHSQKKAAKKVDLNNAGGANGSGSIDWNNVIQNGAPAGSDVSAVFHRVVGYLHSKGMTVDAVVDELAKWINGIGSRYAGRLRPEVQRCFDKWQDRRKITAAEGAVGGDGQAEPDEPIMWEGTDKQGRPHPTCTNTRRALLALGVVCRYDVFHDRHIIEGKVAAKLANLDFVVTDLRRKIHAAYGFDPKKNNTIDAVEQLCIRNRFNPVVDYLDAAEPLWDHTHRLDRWVVTYLGAEDTELNREFGRLALIAAVRRARYPGTKFDPVVVLEGEMGTQKSTAIEVLAGKENFSDQTILGTRDREVQELLAGVWLYEIAELSNIRKTDVEHMKSFISRTVDRARKAYGHFRTDMPRTPIFFATTNNDQYLKEADRRFWPIRTSVIDIEALKRDRDQLWAEASVYERTGMSIVLREDLWATARAAQDERQEHDPWDDLLADIVGTVDGNIEGVESQDLLKTVIGIHISRQGHPAWKRLAACMKRLGWDGPKLVTVGNRRVKGYSRKKPI
jgi:hypothetical protein